VKRLTVGHIAIVWIIGGALHLIGLIP